MFSHTVNGKKKNIKKQIQRHPAGFHLEELIFQAVYALLRADTSCLACLLLLNFSDCTAIGTLDYIWHFWVPVLNL